MIITFQVGTTYSTRSIGDHNCIYSIKVVARTAKTITVEENGERKTLRIKISTYSNPAGVEMVKPHGSYSMCAVIDATDTAKLLTDWDRDAQRKAAA